MKKDPKNKHRPEQLEDHQLLVDALRINCAYSNSILRMDINNGRNEWYDNIVQSYIEQDGVADLTPKAAVRDLQTISCILQELATAFDHARHYIEKENGLRPKDSAERADDVAHDATEQLFRHLMDYIDPKNAHDQGGWASVNLMEQSERIEEVARECFIDLQEYHARCEQYKKENK
jgi:outer membrane PBP1 activator LpoA protein